MTPLRIATRIVIAAGILLVAPAAEADLPPSCVSFTDTPLVAGSTVVKAAHLTELRQCIDDLRAQKSLGPSSWTDPVIVPQQTPVKAAHVTEMRTALNEVYSAAGQQAPSYSGSPIAGVTTIAAAHFNELRSAAQNAPAGPCLVSLSPGAYSGVAPAAGGSGSIAVTAPCSWTVTSSASWLAVSQVSGSGNQTLQFTFAENTSGPRSAYVDVGGQHFNITQGGVGTTADLIYNGDFELGFTAVNVQMGTGQLANGWILDGVPEYPAQLSEAGIPGDKEQWVEVSGGIRQFVTMVPDVEYLLTADIYVSGTVGLYMQTVPVGTIQSVLNVRQGAQRMQLPITHSAAYTSGNVLVSILTAAGATVRIDHVSLRPTAEVMAEEIVQNANFENGFHSFSDANGSGSLANSWTHSGQSTPPQGWFDPGGPSSNLWQNVTGGAFGTGVHQTVTLQANQKYLVRANVQVQDNGGARLAIGPTGGADAQQVYVCGPNNTWDGLATLFTPTYTGLFTVNVKSHIAWSQFSVDDISVTPTSLAAVQASTGGNGYGTECLELHTVTFHVNNAADGQPIEGALVEITPNYGSGPPRTTYPDGTISYWVGEGALQYSVSKGGDHTAQGMLNITSGGTHAVALVAVGDPGGGDPGGGSPDPENPGGAPCGFSFQVAPVSQTSVRLYVSTLPQCTWTVTNQPSGVQVTPLGGTGSGEVTIEMPAEMAADLDTEFTIDIGGYTVLFWGEPPTSGPQGEPNWSTQWVGISFCNDGSPWWLPCFVKIVFVFLPGGSGGSQAEFPPMLELKVGNKSVTSVTRGSSGTFKLVDRTGIGAVVESWEFRSSTGEVQGPAHTREWSGVLVTGGTITVSGTWKGQPFAKPMSFTVTPRPGWTSVPVPPTPRAPGFNVRGRVLAVLMPWEDGYGIGPEPITEGAALLDFPKALPTSDLGRVNDQGPNQSMWFANSIEDTMTFDYTIHSEVDNLESTFAQHQYGDWEGSNISCTAPTGGNSRFIAARVFRDGLIRHESGVQNSHWSEYRDALANPDMNIKAWAESWVAPADLSPQQAYDELKRGREDRMQKIWTAYAFQHCGGQCTPDCLFFNGHLNLPRPNYVPRQ